MSEARPPTTSDPGAIAAAFVAARLAAIALPDYPGAVPRDLEAAYRCQDAAIARWPDCIAGWKVGWIAPERRDASGDERLVGPIFARTLQAWTPDALVEFPIIAGGFAAVEAEYVFRLGVDAPREKTAWREDEAAALVAAVHVGIEVAGSPLATINVLGPAVVASDFGNNSGLILGPAVAHWRARGTLRCATLVAGREVGRAETPTGAPLAALAFALARLARRGRPLRAGDLVTTGAVTGIHDIAVGEDAAVVFEGIATIRCRAVRAERRR